MYECTSPIGLPCKCTISRRPGPEYTLKSPPAPLSKDSPQFLHQRGHERALRICLVVGQYWEFRTRHYVSTYHGLDIGMRHSFELLVLQLVVGTDVDVSTLVLCRVTVSRGREDWRKS
jgi:hypothetical protein